MPSHLVRFGALAQLGRFTSVDGTCYPRRARVVLRTGRGLELGEVLSPPASEEGSPTGDGSILRGVTLEDQLLAARLDQNRQAAFAACEARLRERNLPATLVDVEHLFDGRTLWFYFLGEVTPELSAITDELAGLYEAEVQLRRFAETLTSGCGPGCGTEDAEGHGCQSCATGCAIAGACGTRGERHGAQSGSN